MRGVGWWVLLLALGGVGGGKEAAVSRGKTTHQTERATAAVASKMANKRSERRMDTPKNKKALRVSENP
jgi:hypothetical protein